MIFFFLSKPAEKCRFVRFRFRLDAIHVTFLRIHDVSSKRCRSSRVFFVGFFFLLFFHFKRNTEATRLKKKKKKVVFRSARFELRELSLAKRKTVVIYARVCEKRARTRTLFKPIPQSSVL